MKTRSQKLLTDASKPWASRRHAKFQALVAAFIAIGIAFIAISIAIVPAEPAVAAESSEDTITIGIMESTTYGYLDSTGQPRGYDVEYALEIAQYAHLEPVFKLYGNLDDIYSALKSGEIDMAMDFGKNPDRAADYLYSDYRLNTSSMMILVRADDNRISYSDASTLSGKVYGFLEGSAVGGIFETWCTDNQVTADTRSYKSITAMQDALDSGEVDALVTGYELSDKYRTAFYFDPTDAFVMFDGSNTALKTKIDAAMGQMLSEDPFVDQRLSKKYLSGATNSSVEFSAEQKTYIAKNPTLRIAVIKEDAPYYSVDNGTATGIIPDYYAIIAQKTGFTISYLECDDQASTFQAVKDGKADIVGNYGGDTLTARDDGLLRTTAYVSQVGAQITRTGWSGKISKVAVTDRRAAIIGLELDLSGQDIELVSYKNSNACYEALVSGEVDAIYASLASASWLVNQHGSARLTISARPDISLDVSGAVAQDNQMLCSIINRIAYLSTSAAQGIITDNSTSTDTIQNTVEKMPANYILGFSTLMVLLILGLVITLVLLVKRQRERTKVMHEAAETEHQRVQIEAMAKATDEKNRFFSNISHDMRTPLNAVIGFSQLARHENTDPVIDDYLDKIGESGKLLLGLINDTLTISKSNSGKLELHPEPCMCSDIYNSIVVPVRKNAEDRGVIFVADRSGLRERCIMVDRLNVQKITLNLLSNAIKFTPSSSHVWFTMEDAPAAAGAAAGVNTGAASATAGGNTGAGSATAGGNTGAASAAAGGAASGNTGDRSAAAGGAAAGGSDNDPDTVITVRDEGIGIGREFQDHLYEPFSQELRTGYTGNGAGLGLSIVKELVDLMGGTITCTSEQGKGTTFTVRLHLASTQASAHASESSFEPVELAGHHILLCEDNELNAEIAQRLLDAKGMTSDHAENGQVGVETFAKSAPGTYDAILMDVRMPVMGGIDATRAIRALDRPDAMTVPIIAMTADAFEDDIKRCRDAGMDDHVAKPIDPETLFRALGACIARREAAKRAAEK